MEELDDLKSIWQKSGYEPKGEQEIAAMLKKRSNTIISKLKRSVWFELIFTIVCGIALTVYTFTLESSAMLWLIISLLVMLVSYLFYYVKKIILLKHYDPSNENLKTTLQHLYERLAVYFSLYKRSYAILYPVYFILALLFGAIESGFDAFLQKFANFGFLMAFLLISGAFFLLIYRFTDWYLRKLYGNHIDKLRELLTELED
jgi:hypothetical protein